MNDVPETVLQETLDLLEQGNSIEQILALHPDYAASLRPFLQTAAQLATLAPQPSLAAKQASQKAFLAHAANLKATPVRPSSWYRLRQILLPVVSLAVMLILFGVTAVSVSGAALPGDALYRVKRTVETVRLNQADDPETAVALMNEFIQRRIDEVQALLRTDRSELVTFEGEVQAIQPEQWIVAAIAVGVDGNTNKDEQLQMGHLAQVTGRTGNGTLLAVSITMVKGDVAEPEQEPTPEPSPVPPTATATQTPSPEPTDEPTATQTLTATPTSTATATPTATSTATATPTATATATATPPPPPPPPPPDNNNNNGNDNGNSNDDDDDDDDDDGDSGNRNDNKNDNRDDSDNNNDD